MTMAVLEGYYSKFLSYSEFVASQSTARLIIPPSSDNQGEKNFAKVNTLDSNAVAEKIDEYIPSSNQLTSSAYKKPNSYQNNVSASTDYSVAREQELQGMPSLSHAYREYLWYYNRLNVDLSACDLASPEYALKNVESDLRMVNGEPKIYSLDEIYKATNPDVGILYKVVSPPAGATVPEEVKELGDWYVEHWNEISVSYVSNESKIVSTEDKDLTREEQMKLNALKSAVLFQQLNANEKAGIKEEDYYLRDPLTVRNGYRISTGNAGRYI
jgi:hypothetical protein